MRVLGLDLGERRIGVAVSDTTGTIASPHDVIRRRGDRLAEHVEIAAAVSDVGAVLIVVGLPRSMSGRDGPAAKSVRAEVAELGARVPVPVELWDERLSTVTANRALIEGGVRRRARRDSVDKVAAAVILQSWLDAQPKVEG
ncbi:MAG TPA: Holliday junction resolvase RuvX [Acidimicrobiales bacterium]|nr:Holliday junction resolvase RuvX [Acidimicrobiales bacterium]